jgi:hypothetical protein
MIKMASVNLPTQERVAKDLTGVHDFPTEIVEVLLALMCFQEMHS